MSSSTSNLLALSPEAALDRIAGRERAVLMCGISGSGKTVFARRLEERGYVRLSADGLARARYGDELDTAAPERLREIFALTADELMRLAAEALEHGLRVVVDATMCKRARRDAARRVCAALGVTPLTVWMRAPQEVLLQRLSGRRGSGPDDCIVTPDMLRRFCAGFEAPEPDERYVVIDQE